MGRLDGRTAVITGAASGIGRAASLLFASEGASVLCVDRAEAVADTAEAIEAAGGRAAALTGDAGDEGFVQSYISAAQQRFGGLDVVWANAGISGGWVPYAEQDAAHWAEILRINLIGAFLAVKHASAAMIPAGKGSIILTASVAGIRSGAGGSPYSASKAGVVSLAQTAANEFYGTGVRVNAIAPGLIETGMTRPIFEGARARGNEHKIGQLNPLTRYGVPDEIAHAGLFLASDDSSYVNGQTIAVDGGLSSSHPVVRRKA
jgi:NAD(P)-dependent dehydrogenase (short-subunit alcohol dehydrogenase family)